jgi:hypothetical protein
MSIFELMKKAFKIIIIFFLFLHATPHISAQNTKDSVSVNKNDSIPKKKRFGFFSKKDNSDSTKNVGIVKNDSIGGSQNKSGRAVSEKKDLKNPTKEGRRKIRVQKRFNRKWIRLQKRCKLTADQKAIVGKSKSTQLKPVEKATYNKAIRKMTKWDSKSRKLEKKRHFKMQDKKTRKMIRKTKRNSERGRKNHQKFNRENGNF